MNRISKRMIEIAATCCAVTLVASFGCQAEIDGVESERTGPTDQAEPESADSHEHELNVHWRTVDSFEDMVAVSHLVARGRVVARRHENLPLLPWDAEKQRYRTPAEAGEERAELPITVSTVELREVVREGDGTQTLSGEGVKVDAQIEIVERGGILPCGCLEQPSDKPLLREGEEAVFFLTSAGKVGSYHVVGGWQGRLMIAEQKVTSLAARLSRDADPFAEIRDVPLATIIERIRGVTAPPLSVRVSPFSKLAPIAKTGTPITTPVDPVSRP